MNTGYIFGMWPDGKPVSDRETKNPYFAKCLYRIRANQLIDMKFLTKPIVGEIGSEHYDTINMKINKLGQFERDDVDRAYNGHGRKTSSIIEDIVRQSCNRKGVMIFAATVQHADECMASLPRELSAIVTSETKKTDRDYILKMFKRRKIKYLVNVAVLTTGFDAEHVDVIAILRATESVGLLQQIIGRGLRLCDGKDDCLILDYAENIERHCPDGDIFAPEISVRGSDKENGETECKCPICDVTNVFSSRPNPDKYDVSEDGYFVDLDGNKIETDWGYMPSHFGRRCRGKTLYRGELIQCDYRWTSKPCPKCMEENDIAARYCCKCKSEIVDPNEKLKIEFKQLKRDPTQMQTDVVTGWVVSDSLSKKGKDMHKVEVKTPFRSFTVWVMKVPTFPRAWSDLRMLQSLNGEAPKTVTYRKDSETGFYQIFAYNEEADEIPERS
jgi:DNA repair protein RadD